MNHPGVTCCPTPATQVKAWDEKEQPDPIGDAMTNFTAVLKATHAKAIQLFENSD